MMPVDLGDDPYTVNTLPKEPEPPTTSKCAYEEKWDWNKLFTTIDAGMNNSTSKSKEDLTQLPEIKEVKCNFKYCSPFGNENKLNLPAKTDFKLSKTDESILSIHGFKLNKKLNDSLQGSIYEGETIQKYNKRKVIIKKTMKNLHNKHITIEDNGLNIIVDENAVKEAILLHHLTVNNKPLGDNICKLHSFFESCNAYYIILEHCGHITLQEFVVKAHKYIKLGKLSINHWKKICKYILWQINITFHWLHNDMNVCHLDFKMENIMIQNGNFIVNRKNNTIRIDHNVNCKIIDFGLSECFKDDGIKQKQYFEYDPDCIIKNKLGLFHLNSNHYSITSNHYHICPQIFNEQVFDGRKADIYGIGIIMFYMLYGIYPYQKQILNDYGFASLKYGQLHMYLHVNGLGSLYDSKWMELIYHCLNIDENNRYDINQIIKHNLFKSYYKKYNKKIIIKSKEQLIKNINNKYKNNMKIPYYKPT